MSTTGGKYEGTGTKADLDNHADQCNPNNPEYAGHESGYKGDGTKADRDNHSDQMNPNNPKYQGGKWRSIIITWTLWTNCSYVATYDYVFSL